MGKMTTYVILTGFLLLIYHFMGIISSGSISGQFFTMLLNPENLPLLELWGQSLGAIAAVGFISAVVITSAFFSNTELAAMSALASFMLVTLFDLVIAYGQIADAIEFDAVSLLIFAPILILMVLTVVDWWRGKD